MTGQEKDSGHDGTVAERPGGPPGCHLAASTMRSPRHAQQPLRTAGKKQLPLGPVFLGRLWCTQRKVTPKHRRKTHLCLPLGCGRGSVLETGIRLWGVPRGRSRNAHAFPSTQSLPQDITQDEGCAPASKRQSRGPARLEPALGNSAATGSCPAPAVLPVTLCLTSTPEGGPREG